jgi:cell wall-associated NlpC family hydrolase
MVALDPRIHAFRPEIAAHYLKGQVEAQRFVEGVRYQVIEPTTALRHAPSHDARLDSEVLLGERAIIYETTEEGWAWGQLETDGYVGWLSANALGKPGPAPTHKVCVPRTLCFPAPDIKLPPLESLPMGCQIAVARTDGPFAVTTARLYLPAAHVAPIDHREQDFVAVAERFVGAPYLWGGKSSLGLDCSGLVQIALTACGIACPRDSDMQAAAVGESVPLTSPPAVRRGDLLFWKGHVAIARDAATIIHGNAFHMAVAIEPLVNALTRIRSAGSELISIRRLVD